MTMTLESEYYNRSRPDFARLEEYGFRKQSDGLYYSETIMDGQFRADIKVSQDGAVSGRLIDLETEDEYLPIRVRNQMGEFVGEVREAYLDLLERIGRACFLPVHFMSDQANRVEAKIYGAYDAAAEFPWERYPGNGVFKCKGNEKWFAAILTVEYGKLDGASEDAGRIPHEEDEVVEVVNLKADPDEIAALVKKSGVYPAWHMNKKHWISVILDDTVPDEYVMELLGNSHRLVRGGKGTKVRSTGAWMIPSNPKVYDVDAGFRDGGGEIEWHQHNQVRAGDQVYIYCSAPYSAILYHCEVVVADLSYHGMFAKSKGYEKSMRIRLIEKYPPDRIPLSFIKEHGGSVVRSARTMPEELFEAIKKMG